MLIDSHAHLDFDKFDEDRDEVLARAQRAGVDHIISIGTHLASIDRAIQLAAQYPTMISASAGFHPLYLEDDHPTGWESLYQYAQRDEVCGIGETGLDYYYHKDVEQQTKQKVSFRKHLQLAQKVNKAIIVHIRDAFDDAFQITQEEGLGAGGVVHCFTGGIDECKRALDLGYYISLSGVVTFKNAKALRTAVPYIPTDRFLLETDAPFLAPVPHRSKRNEPAFVIETAKVVADLMQVSLSDLCQMSVENTKRLFSIS